MFWRLLQRLLPAVLIAVLVLLMQASSCGERCCDCSQSAVFSGMVCEENMPAMFSDWAGYRKALADGGCSCQ
jgi:hypothetical protein